MSVLVCVPVYRVKSQVLVEEGRAWTPVEELILWAISGRALSIAELVSEANLSHQIVV
jgi:cardiolipin synthase A/B